MAARKMSSTMRKFLVASAVWLMVGDHAWAGNDYVNPVTMLFPPNEVLCSQVDDHRLDVGASCVASIKAEISENAVGLHLQASGEYIVSVVGKQAWYDASHEHIAPKGAPGTWLMNLFALLKKNRDAKWFALIAEIKGVDKWHLHDLSESPNLLAEEEDRLRSRTTCIYAQPCICARQAY